MCTRLTKMAPLPQQSYHKGPMKDTSYIRVNETEVYRLRDWCRVENVSRADSRTGNFMSQLAFVANKI